MRERLEVESPDLAARFRALGDQAQAHIADVMVQRALMELSPPLELPDDAGALFTRHPRVIGGVRVAEVLAARLDELRPSSDVARVLPLARRRTVRG